MGERTRYDPGTFCWVGLATSDVAAAKAFYRSVFGWEAEDLDAGVAGVYTMLHHGGKEVAILYRQQPEARAADAPPHWTSYISVDDVDATAARAEELGGGAVFRAPFDVLDAGRVAAIGDPTGAVVSIWQPRSRIGAQLVNDSGALCWNELATTDIERAESFFGEPVRLGVRDRRQRLRLGQERRSPQRRHAQAVRAGAARSARVAAVFRPRLRR
jgi:predicted enzyme related to lactoylglutathione lyase